jgi:LmbE family N-acetylglucosaminyl deacetylase
VATLVSFHAHPDDESIATGGTIARAVDEGHRVVLVFATRGECGEVPDGFLDDGEELGHRRERETAASAAALGAQRVEFLGYRDSGMVGEPTNEDPACFWAADVEEAAERLARILTEEQAEVLTVYDDHGGYGHPDHIQVHRVGHRAAQIAGTPRVFESTMNRDHLRALIERAREEAADVGIDDDDVARDEAFGSPASIITTTVDVRGWVERKRESMRLHASQIAEESFFLAMPDAAFTEAFGWEWYIRTAGEPVGDDDWLLPG